MGFGRWRVCRVIEQLIKKAAGKLIGSNWRVYGEGSLSIKGEGKWAVYWEERRRVNGDGNSAV